MRNLLLTLCYDGSAYHGWQVQRNAVSVQQVFQQALEKVTGTRPDVKGCSRTDTGVHARRFCCSFHTEHTIPPERRTFTPAIPAGAKNMNIKFGTTRCATRFYGIGRSIIIIAWIWIA